MNKKKILLPVIFLALGVGGFMALKASKPKPPPVQAQEPTWRLEVLTVQIQPMGPVLALTGTVESPELTRAAAPGIGRIGRVLVREGQPVRPGQLLLEMDARDFQPRVEQARGQVQELEAAIRSEELRHAADLDQLRQEQKLLEFAAADLARFEQLQRENFYSPAAVDQSRSNLARQQLTLRSRELAIADHKARLAQLQARLSQAHANLDQAQLAAARSRVTAPFAGFVAKLEVAEGDQVNTGQDLISLYPSDGLEVRAMIPAPHQEEILAQIGKGAQLLATAEVAGETLEFRLARVAGAADTRGLDGFFQAKGANPNLRVGSLVSLQLVRAPVPGAIAVPYTALYGGRQVYRVVDGRLQAVDVEVLGELPGRPPRLLLKSPGLKAGDLLAVTHLPNAVTGLKVQVSQPAKP
ncbi:MAG: biotin/lipoyl-binding protein [Gammaproteobacteria bacterium]|nr:MAG: biotin/lipoyl-binding protein [Gammaproteobacteria bacterium]